MTVRRDLDVLAERRADREGARRRDAGPRRRAWTSRASRRSRRGSSARRRRSDARPPSSCARARPSRSRPAPRPGRWPATSAHIRDLTIVTNSIRVADVLQQRPRKSDGDPDRRRAHPVRRAGRPGRRPRHPVAALRRPLRRLPRHRPAGAGSPRPTSRSRRPTAASSAARRTVVLVADHTKWATVGLSSFAELERGRHPRHRHRSFQGSAWRRGRSHRPGDRGRRGRRRDARHRGADKRRRAGRLAALARAASRPTPRLTTRQG